MNISEPELFIDGRFRSASGVQPVIDATTEQLLGEGPSASLGDIDDAVAASRRALREWSTTPAVDRAHFLERFADALAARAVDTSELCTPEIGAPITFSRIMNGLIPEAVLRYYAALISKTDGEEIRPSASGHTIVRREPVGVVGIIVPWNVPQVLAAMKLAPALAAGCTVIIGTVAFSYSGAFGLSVLIWQHSLGIPLSWLGLPLSFIVLVAVGSDYNLLLVARYLEESKAGLNTALIRAVANSGNVVTTAGLVFAVTMMAMVSGDLLSVGEMGSIIGLGLLLDTLIVRSFITAAIARVLGPFFWWPRLIRSRPPLAATGRPVAPVEYAEIL